MLLKKLCFFAKKHKEITQEQKATQGCDLDGSVMQGEWGKDVGIRASPPFFQHKSFSLPTGKNPTLNQLTLNQEIMAKSRKKETIYYLGYTSNTGIALFGTVTELGLEWLKANHKYIEWKSVSKEVFEDWESEYAPNQGKTLIP